MSSQFSRWLRSKNGTRTLIGTAAALLVVVILGTFLGWWAAIAELMTGTAAPPIVGYPPPEDGYTCLPTCDVTDGKFLALPGTTQASFTAAPVVFWINVPGDYESFEIGFFDGDSDKDSNGNINRWEGHWDEVDTEVTYTLYADPLKDGLDTKVIGTWYGNQDNMPDNDWFNVTIENISEAQGPSGHYFYRLEATRPAEGNGTTVFKVRSTAYLSTGADDRIQSTLGIIGMLGSLKDIPILYPEFAGDYTNPGPSTYTGDWQFYFYVPEDQGTMEIWDGDFDRGSWDGSAYDTDDPNTEFKPPWAGPTAVNERAGGRGSPADDFTPNPLAMRTPPVWYELLDPDGVPVYENKEPSGTEEWERYVISTDPGANPDQLTDRIKPGFYTYHIAGLDLHNYVTLRLEYEVCPPDDCGPPVCDATCPRTIGYWKNNVKKVLIEGRTKGVQETPESIHAALDLIALKSPLYRHGIDVTNPQPIDTVQRLTDEEVHMILQRDQKSYPGGKDQANSMLARALQQDLAAWLNWGSGKVCDNTGIVLTVADGTFEGKLWDALLEAQDIVLNGGNLERAKDIGDQINNGNLGEDATLEVATCDITDPNDGNSKDYRDKFPPEKQPPKYGNLKKAPKGGEPPNPTPVPEPDPETCAGVRVNHYNVEATSNPFAGVKFEYQSGIEVKNGDFEEFKLVLTREQAQALTSVQMEAKAGTDIGQVTLESCDFTSPLPCSAEPVRDANNFFAFYFMGAEDNGDGTLTLTFNVQNMTGNGLSHATIGIPDAQVPGSYESKVCPPQ